MRLSARNQLRGSITAVHHGEVMSTVKAVLGDGQPLTAAITKDAAEDLDLAPGDAVVMIVKSTEVMVAKNLTSLTAPPAVQYRTAGRSLRTGDGRLRSASPDAVDALGEVPAAAAPWRTRPGTRR